MLSLYIGDHGRRAGLRVLTGCVRCVRCALAVLCLTSTRADADPSAGCWRVIDGTAVLRPGRKGLVHTYTSRDDHKPGEFYFKPTGPDTYLLHDLNNSYMTAGVAAKTWVTAQPRIHPASDKDWPEWKVTRRPNTDMYDFQSTRSLYYLRVASDTFTEAAAAPPTNGFRLERRPDHECKVPPEPRLGTDAQVPRFRPGQPIVGIADVHSHALANEGFGGLALQGKPFHPWGMAGALAWCDWAFGLAAHGAGGLNDLIGNLMDGRTGHPVGGAPAFDGWPLWYSTTHQQMYYKWLERAHRGGLRLQVLLAVNNEVLCAITNRAPGRPCNDMTAVDIQLEQARALEAFIDNEHGGPGKGWLRIVHTPAEARSAIEAGKLAVVLGIEVDNLFNCNDRPCTEERIRILLDSYHKRGVRYIFPVHVFDNAFGGAALINPIFNIGNVKVNGAAFDVRDCSADGYEYNANFMGFPIGDAIYLIGRILNLPIPPRYPGTRHCNSRRLTPAGEILIREMMNRKMIIDVDHMSASTFEDVMKLAEQRSYPVIAGHTGFTEISIRQKKSEGQKSPAQIERIRKLGGLVAPILHQGTVQEIKPWGTTVAMDCDESSKAWAQAYLYAVDKMGPDAAVPLGSDLNGWIRMPAPRFAAGTNESGRPCNRNRPQLRHQKNPIVYPFTLLGGSFGKMTSGDRVFDFNSDGFAHVGMLPDFVKDLENVGVSQDKLAPLFRSAEGFITMWEKIERTQP